MILDQFKLNFVPHPDAVYDFDYERIVGEMNLLASGSSSARLIQFVRYWCQESLFFLMYFPLRCPVNNPWLVERIKEVQECNTDTLDLWAREHWKALAIDTPVLTVEEGWKRHVDLEPGDTIYGLDGRQIKVVANTGVMTGAPCRRINFHDGFLVASSQHEWLIQKKHRRRVVGSDLRNITYEDVVVETDQLPVKDWNYRVPRTPILQNQSQLLQLDPYVLGVWLGDGTSDRGDITTADPEIFDSFRMAGFNDIVETTSKYGYRIGSLKFVLKLMDLLGNKHIPYRYFIGSPAQRLALLQGLMDTDGSCNDRGTAEFTNTNEKLVSGVHYLAASLGMQPHINQFESQNSGANKPTFQVQFQAYKNIPPFRLARKLARCKNGLPTNGGRYINSIEEVASEPVNCIQVDSADGVYLAGYNLVPTHNSTIITYALNIQDILKDPNTRIGIFSHTRAIAKAFLRKIKITLEDSAILKATFPDILFDNPQSQAPKWSEDDGLIVRRSEVHQECTVEAWGLTDGQPTSKHFLVLNYDDVVTRESVSTPVQIQKTEECFRLSDNLGAVGGKKRVIGTIYHFADLHCKLKKEGGWIVREYPAEKVSPETGEFTGEGVFMSADLLAKKRRNQGPYVYNCQMLLKPTAKKDQKFKAEWLQYYRTLPENLCLVLLCDPANAKKEKTSGLDSSVFWLWGLDSRGNKFLVDAVRDKLSLTERWLALKKMVLKHPGISLIGYEQYGMTSDVQHFYDKMGQEGTYFTITEMGGNKLSKVDRILRLVPDFENKKVWLPEHLEYQNKEGDVVDVVKMFVDDEFLVFPFSAHDDMLDAASRIKDEGFEIYTPYDEQDETLQEAVGSDWIQRQINGYGSGSVEAVGRDRNTGY